MIMSARIWCSLVCPLPISCFQCMRNSTLRNIFQPRSRLIPPFQKGWLRLRFLQSEPEGLELSSSSHSIFGADSGTLPRILCCTCTSTESGGGTASFSLLPTRADWTSWQHQMSIEGIRGLRSRLSGAQRWGSRWGLWGRGRRDRFWDGLYRTG